MTESSSPLISVRDLSVALGSRRGNPVPVLDGISFDVARGETLGIVGESGCGKSLTALSLMRLLPAAARVTGGSVRFQGKDLIRCTDSEMRSIRGNDIAMIFQEPMSSLNPVFSAGEQIVEAIIYHGNVTRAEAKKRAIDALDVVGIPSPARRFDDYPHQMSGGMLQRVMIAMALATKPNLLIADEPTTALDVTVQAQILDLLRNLQADTGMSVIIITHDLGVIADFAERVMVMYAGRVVEESGTDDLFNLPLHPYTDGLLRSIPQIDQDVDRLYTIEGTVPPPGSWPEGCRYAPRCPYAIAACGRGIPDFLEAVPNHRVACIRYDEALRNQFQIEATS